MLISFYIHRNEYKFSLFYIFLFVRTEKHFYGGTLLLNDKCKKQCGLYSTNIARKRKILYVCVPGLISEMLSKNKKCYEYTNVDYIYID